MTLVDALIAKATQTKQPISGTFELTARCNLSCKMCYIHDEKNDASLRVQELTSAQWRNLADQAASAGTLLLLLTGGEPMIRPDFAEIYRACAERGFLLTVNTNGTLLTDEIFALFQEHPPLRLNVSLYGYSENTYKELCGNGAAFFRVRENLLRLHELGISLQINFSATPLNTHELAQVAAFAQELNAHLQCTAYMFPPTRKDCRNCFERFSAEEAGRISAEYQKIRHSASELATISTAMLQEAPPSLEECNKISDGVRCRAGKAAFWITFDGKMLPCGMLSAISAPASDFAEAWNQTVEAAASITAPKGCLSCKHYAHCDVCPAICFAENRDFSIVPEYICRKNQTYRESLSKFAREAEEAICD